MAEMKCIARIHTDFPQKFGIPRQSGLVAELKGTVVFEPEYRNPDMLRGLEGFSHIWLIWSFSESKGWSPTRGPTGFWPACGCICMGPSGSWRQPA